MKVQIFGVVIFIFLFNASVLFVFSSENQFPENISGIWRQTNLMDKEIDYEIAKILVIKVNGISEHRTIDNISGSFMYREPITYNAQYLKIDTFEYEYIINDNLLILSNDTQIQQGDFVTTTPLHGAIFRKIADIDALMPKFNYNDYDNVWISEGFNVKLWVVFDVNDKCWLTHIKYDGGCDIYASSYNNKIENSEELENDGFFTINKGEKTLKCYYKFERDYLLISNIDGYTQSYYIFYGYTINDSRITRWLYNGDNYK
ncbi:MAG: hypothetical protein LBU85_03475 [Treponema sp.]|jgi:hypothetical protein|nr:hypothetical protein [Treponema sp.]